MTGRSSFCKIGKNLVWFNLNSSNFNNFFKISIHPTFNFHPPQPLLEIVLEIHIILYQRKSAGETVLEEDKVGGSVGPAAGVVTTQHLVTDVSLGHRARLVQTQHEHGSVHRREDSRVHRVQVHQVLSVLKPVHNVIYKHNKGDLTKILNRFEHKLSNHICFSTRTYPGEITLFVNKLLKMSLLSPNIGFSGLTKELLSEERKVDTEA